MEFLHCLTNCELLKKVCAICGVNSTHSSSLLNCDAILQCCGFSVVRFPFDVSAHSISSDSTQCHDHLFSFT
jgi:hypothetical protein